MDIPEDILRTATEVAEVWFHEEWEPENYIQQDLVKAIGHAIQAERERAAEIAETYVDDDGTNAVGRVIARLIRTPPTGEEQ